MNKEFRLPIVVMLFTSLLFTGCVSQNKEYSNSDEIVDDQENYSNEVWDPFEPFNRDVYAFNLALVDLVDNPPSASKERAAIAAKKRAEAGLPPLVVEADPGKTEDSDESEGDNFFTFLLSLVGNLGRFVETPLHLVNSILQGDGDAIEKNFARLLINSTLGLGFLDVADSSGIANTPRDFGQTLGIWGVPEGPFLMLPVFGATTLRDTAGRVTDSIALDYSIQEITKLPDGWSTGLKISETAFRKYNEGGGKSIELGVADALEIVNKTSIDPYTAVKSAYVQKKRASYQTQDQQIDNLPDIDDLLEE